MIAYKEIEGSRVNGSKNLVSVLNLGHQVLTRVFPKSKSEQITSYPLEFVCCPDSGRLQFKHSYEASEMCGENYGYRSGPNQSMANHLTDKIRYLECLVPLNTGKVLIDIGSNDVTMQSFGWVPPADLSGLASLMLSS